MSKNAVMKARSLKERRDRHVWGPRMVLILAAMASVSAAFFAGLYLQGGLPLFPSLIASIAIFLALFGTMPRPKPASVTPQDMQVRLESFENEIDRLSGQLAQVSGLSGKLGELDQLAPSVAQLQHFVSDMQQQMALQDDNGKSAVKFAALSQQLQDLDGRITSLNQTVAGAGDRRQFELQSQIAELGQMVRQMAEKQASQPETQPETQSAPFAAPRSAMANNMDFAPEPGEILQGQNEHRVREVRRSIEQAQKTPLGDAPASSLARSSSIPDPAGGQPIDGDEEQLLAIVSAAIKERRMDIFLQPVVTLPQRKIIYYEVFSRLRNESGGLIMPEMFVPVAERATLMPLIDNMMLVRAIKIIRQMEHHTSAKGLFCSLSTQSLVDPDFFPRLVAFLENNRDLAGRIIFEISQAQKKSAGHVELESMRRLAKLGFAYSLDKVIDLDIDYNDLARRHYKFVRISAERLIHGMADLGARIHGADKAHYLERYGIELIVERIETERELATLSDYNISLGQGYLFAEPRPVRPEVLGEQAA